MLWLWTEKLSRKVCRLWSYWVWQIIQSLKCIMFPLQDVEWADMQAIVLNFCNIESLNLLLSGLRPIDKLWVKTICTQAEKIWH